jgi:hypothetical protein
VKGQATLVISGASNETLVSITDVKGNQIWNKNYTGISLINLPAENLASGVYVITVTSGPNTKNIKMVKQ